MTNDRTSSNFQKNCRKRGKIVVFYALVGPTRQVPHVKFKDFKFPQIFREVLQVYKKSVFKKLSFF